MSSKPQPRAWTAFRPTKLELGNALAGGGWRGRAACLDADPEAFFVADRTAEALAYCAGCPVVAECRAAGAGEAAGVWGGRSRGRGRDWRARPDLGAA